MTGATWNRRKAPGVAALAFLAAGVCLAGEALAAESAAVTLSFKAGDFSFREWNGYELIDLAGAQRLEDAPGTP